MSYVKLAGTTNRHENYTTRYVLERDEETGEETKVVEAGVPIELSAEDRKKLEALGAVFEDSSAAEAKEVEEQQQAAPVASDTAAAGPRLGGSGAPNQQASPKGDDKDNK